MLILRIILGLLRVPAVALIGGGMMVGLFPYFGVHALALMLKDLGKARHEP